MTVTWDPAFASSAAFLYNSDLSCQSHGFGLARSTVARGAGKWYAEITCDFIQFPGYPVYGFMSASSNINRYPGFDSTGYGIYSISGDKYNNNIPVAYGATFANNPDIVSLLYDGDNGTITFWVNGVSFGTAFSGVFDTLYLGGASGSSAPQNSTFTGNFGATAFGYQMPVGYTSWDGSQSNLETSSTASTATVSSSTSSTSSLSSHTPSSPTSQTSSSSSSGKEVVVTWNPLDKGSFVTLSNGNLTSTNLRTNTVRATVAHDYGQHQFEIRVDTVEAPNAPIIGVGTLGAALTGYIGVDANGWSYYGVPTPGNTIHSNGSALYGIEILVGDIVTVLLDSDAGTLTFKVNGVSQGVAFNTGLAGLMLYPAVSSASTGDFAEVYTANFGATPLTYGEPGYENWNIVDPRTSSSSTRSSLSSVSSSSSSTSKSLSSSSTSKSGSSFSTSSTSSSSDSSNSTRSTSSDSTRSTSSDSTRSTSSDSTRSTSSDSTRTTSTSSTDSSSLDGLGDSQDAFFRDLFIARGQGAPGLMPKKILANLPGIHEIHISFYAPDAYTCRSAYYYNARHNMLYVRKPIRANYAVWQPVAYF